MATIRDISPVAPIVAADMASSFAMSFVSSEAFKALFREGMGLVESTAAYLDGPGREQSRGLSRMPALAYASESMRLTTRLMQIASWLLLQRAVAEGELTVDQARREKHKVRVVADVQPPPSGAFEDLPADLRDLVGRSLRLQARVAHLDRLLNGGGEMPPVESPVAKQLSMLESALEVRRRL